MQIHLLRVPYVDDDGFQRERVSAVVIGEDVTPERARAVKDFLQKAESEPSVLAVDQALVSWL